MKLCFARVINQINQLEMPDDRNCQSVIRLFRKVSCLLQPSLHSVQLVFICVCENTYVYYLL